MQTKNIALGQLGPKCNGKWKVFVPVGKLWGTGPCATEGARFQTAPTAKRRARACPSPGWLFLETKKIVDIQREFVVNFNQLFTVPNVLGVSREGKAMEGRQ